MGRDCNARDVLGQVVRFFPVSFSDTGLKRRSVGRRSSEGPGGRPRPVSLPVPEWARGARRRAAARGLPIHETVENVPVLPTLHVDRVRQARRASVEAKRKRDAEAAAAKK
jgi:hypothetical protein